MGLPEINFEFKSKAASAIERSARGTVALVLDDATNIGYKEYTGIEDVTTDDYTADNVDLISLAFQGTPNKVIVQTYDTASTETTMDGVSKLELKHFDYLATPHVQTGETTDVASFITGQRDNNSKKFKAVLPDQASDHEGVINFTTQDIETEEKTYTTAEYTARIAGVLAGMPLTRSATYYQLNDVEGITESTQPDSDIDNGELILINDGEKVKIARGVNSLTSFTPEKSEQFSKITVVEKMDMIRKDVSDTFEDNYVGKVTNDYDNKMLFLSAVNGYFNKLVRDNVLDPSGDNRAEIDFVAQKNYLQGIGVEVNSLKAQQILEYNTGSHVFATASVRITDTIEDLTFNIAV